MGLLYGFLYVQVLVAVWVLVDRLGGVDLTRFGFVWIGVAVFVLGWLQGRRVVRLWVREGYGFWAANRRVLAEAWARVARRR